MRESVSAAPNNLVIPVTKRITPILFLTTLSFLTLNMFAQGNVTFDKDFTPSIIGPGSVSTLTFTIVNNSGQVIEEVAFTDNLPAGILVATPAAAISECEGTLSATAEGSTIAFSGGRIGANSSCTIKVNVTGTAMGTYTNITSDLTYGASGTSSPAQADITIDNARPGFTKSFSSSSIDLGECTTLTFTINNTANGNPAYNTSFLDQLPAGLEIADPPNISTDCGGTIEPTIVAIPGTNLISFNHFTNLPTIPTVPANGVCTLSVDVIASGAGSLLNVTSDLTTAVGFQSLTCGIATAQLDVTTATVHLQKEFVNDPLIPGGMGNIEYTLSNFDRGSTASNITFTDNLDDIISGMVASGLPLNDICGTGSSMTGSSVLTFSGGTLAPGASCSFTVPIQVPSSAVTGSYSNTTSIVSADLGGTPTVGNAATAKLFVADVPIFTKTFLSDAAPGGTVELEFTITNTNATAALTDVTFSDEFDVIFQTASIEPTDGDCGAGSEFTFTPLVDPISQSATPARLTMTGGSIPAGSTCTFSITLDVLESAVPGISTNVTSALSGMIDGNPVAASPATDEVEILPSPRFKKEFLNDPVVAGGTVDLEYTISHDESALFPLTDIVFTDDLDGLLSGLVATGLPVNNICGAGAQLTGSGILTFNGGSLDPGESCSFIVTLQVPAAAASTIYESNSSSISATYNGISVVGEPAEDELVVSGLILSKEFTDDPVNPGGQVTLEFTLNNTSSDDLENISFTDDLDANLSGLTSNGLPMSDVCGTGSVLSLGSGNLLIFSGGTLAANSSCVFSVMLDVPANAVANDYTNVTSLVNANKVIGGENVIGPAASDELSVVDPITELIISKTFLDNPVFVGESATLEFEISFVGPADATNISFTDDLDAMLSGLMATSLPDDGFCGIGSSMSGTNLLTMTGGTLASGEACIFTVEVSVPETADEGEYTNLTSTITADGGISGASASATLIVEDNIARPRLADAGPDQNITCNGVNGTNVTLDASASTTIYPPIISYTWTEFGNVLATGMDPITTVNLDLGVHIITLEVQDFSGASIDEVVITITDTENPVITCPDGSGTPFTLPADANCQASIPDYSLEASATDNCSESLVITQNPPAGTLLTGDGTSKFITLSTNDGNGNNAECSFTVTVQDLTPPVIQCPANILQNVDEGQCASTVSFADPTANDNCGIASIVCVPASGSPFPLGTTEVTCTVTDINGLSNQCTFEVTITDNEPPIASCQDISIQLDPTGNASIVAADVDNGSSDLCGMVTLSTSVSSFTCADVGPNEVVLTVTDESGNSSMCTATVTVLDDNAKPEADIVQSELPGLCQGANVVLTAQPTGVTYIWSTGETTESIVVGPGFYEVTVSNGCSDVASITVDFDAEDLLSAYTIISTDKEVNLKKENVVLNGGVGVMNPDEEAKIEDNTDISGATTFVFASSIIVSGGSTVTNQILGVPPIILPAFVNHTASGGSDVTVNEDDITTLGGSVYKKVELKKNSIVTFTSQDLSIEELKVEEGVTIEFDQCTEVKVKKGLDFDKSVTVNPDSQGVIIYAEKADIKEGSRIIADIYTSGELKVKGKSDDTTYMTGLFIGEKVVGDDHVYWDWNLNCDCNLVSARVRDQIVIVEKDLQRDVQIRPNPFSESFDLSGRIVGLIDEGVMRISDFSGREVLRYTFDSEDVQWSINAGEWIPGMYYLTIFGTGKSQTYKLVKVN